ncbi:DUF2141 domain-containing protein [Croceivirga radicis]|uniref:DUF2141 domain-containing protein n=1 Tax=Croceivirga radicis TaxID=1929488 RepID=A0A1V6LV48_9FLAO|nr:DUF2141 domain-containing protein [Croceivirga radicis]OQD44040.1 hypothetical protein BUL40_00345 [Croceivirga radicis]
MIKFKLLLFACVFFAITQGYGQEVEVEVHKVPSDKGNISVAVYKQEEGFLKEAHVYKYNKMPAVKGVTKVSLENMPEGEYALAIFHDENGNDRLDMNWLGIPKEKVAFSVGKMKTFGPPNFKECAFLHQGKHTKIVIEL